MKVRRGVAGRCVIFAVLTLALMVFAQTIQAQTVDSQHSGLQQGSKEYRTFYLTNAVQSRDFTEIQTVLRNLLSRARVYGVPSQNALLIYGTPDELALAQKIISDTDRAPKTYRLTYTITEMKDGASEGTRDVSLVVASGGRTTVKQGSRVPIATGVPNSENGAVQMQYLDVGLSIEASVDGAPDHLRLHTRVEQSSVAEGKTAGATAQDPVIRQTSLDGVSDLGQGNAVVLGTLGIRGSSRHEQISVRSEVVQ